MFGLSHVQTWQQPVAEARCKPKEAVDRIVATLARRCSPTAHRGDCLAPAPAAHWPAMPEATDTQALPALLQAAAAGDPAAAALLFDALYDELHRLARRELRVRAGGLTLGATTLLHETYLDLSRRGVHFPDRGRFFAYAARAMRGLIVDQIRQRRALKRGAEFHFTAWDTEGAEGALPAADAQELGDALGALGQADPALAELVDLKFFGGLDFAEIARLRGVSERTVQRHWEKARLFLRHALRDA